MQSNPSSPASWTTVPIAPPSQSGRPSERFLQPISRMAPVATKRSGAAAHFRAISSSASGLRSPAVRPPGSSPAWWINGRFSGKLPAPRILAYFRSIRNSSYGTPPIAQTAKNLSRFRWDQQISVNRPAASAETPCLEAADLVAWSAANSPRDAPAESKSYRIGF